MATATKAAIQPLEDRVVIMPNDDAEEMRKADSGRSDRSRTRPD